MARFAAKTDDVQDVYQRIYESRRPQVYLDGTSRVLRSIPGGQLPIQPVQPLWEDFEGEWHGTCVLFLVVEPLRGFRCLWVRPPRTTRDVADVLRDLVDGAYPDAEKIVLVVDRLNIHHPESLYRRFAPAEVCRITTCQLAQHRRMRTLRLEAAGPKGMTPGY